MENQVVAKILYGSDLRSYMYLNEKSKGLCPFCGSVVAQIVNPEFRVKRMASDLAYTYDHYCIVTDRFKEFCETNGYEQLTFIPITNSDCYFFQPNTIFPLDPVRREIRFKNFCEHCSTYRYVIGATPSYKVQDYEEKADFIYRSNYSFGSDDKKSPIIIVGLETMKKMKQAKLKGLYFKDVYQ
jgi:hypothetical protein